VLFVSHRKPLLEVWRRDIGGIWSHSAARAGQTMSLESIACELAVDDLYRDPLAASA
jgi:hypothetical protein